MSFRTALLVLGMMFVSVGAHAACPSVNYFSGQFHPGCLADTDLNNSWKSPPVLGQNAPNDIYSNYLQANSIVSNGPIKVPARIVNASGPITVSLTTDNIICVNKTANEATTVNLPNNPDQSLSYTIKDCKGNAATYPITLAPASGTIDGSATYAISGNNGALTVAYIGSQWQVLNLIGSGTGGGPPTGGTCLLANTDTCLMATATAALLAQ